MADIIILAAVAVLFGFIFRYIRKEKKRGVQCIGCPSSQCGSCSGCHSHDASAQ